VLELPGRFEGPARRQRPVAAAVAKAEVLLEATVLAKGIAKHEEGG